MKQLTTIIIILLFSQSIIAQVENTGMTDRPDSIDLGKLKVSGYVDVYYGFDFNQPANSDRPYAVSSPRHNEFNINLAYVDLKYQNDRVRARFTPGVGTYVNSNYASESGSLKNIIEANAGVKLSKTKEIWIDAGVMGAPYTNESAISKDHFMYTRSFGPEYSPYYISGVRLSSPLGSKLTGYLYLINGWQQISDINKPLSVTTQLEYKPTNKLLVNWNTYVGSEQSTRNPNYGNRYFSDIYAIYNPEGRFGFTTSLYAGIQDRTDTLTGKKEYARWWNANFIGKYKFNKQYSLAGRIEYFEDLQDVVVHPVTNITGYSSWSTGLCFNIKITNNAMFRAEGRYFFSDRNIYINAGGNPAKNSTLLISNLTVWF